ncbi:hypothetical protein R1sor_018592 [Riccia sorocarpa]|uniref:DUF3444 domain-containing protein n=1 Tax=Riccia sorocarpa TaxID=122646 RepID=A0ABD3IDP9_9MARC
MEQSDPKHECQFPCGSKRNVETRSRRILKRRKYSSEERDEYVFRNFDSSRTELDIIAGQVWAFYDDEDGMPRFYARVAWVCFSPFKANLSWLEPVRPRGKMYLTQFSLPVSCGKFRVGESETTNELNIFSHLVLHNMASGLVKIFPKKGEVWAVYRDWDQGPFPGPKCIAQTDGTRRAYKYELVEVLTNYSIEQGCKVVGLMKVPGFPSLFQEGSMAVKHFRPSDLSQFSHNILSERTFRDDTRGIPSGALELDPAAIPAELNGNIPEFIPPVTEVNRDIQESHTPSSERMKNEQIGNGAVHERVLEGRTVESARSVGGEEGVWRKVSRTEVRDDKPHRRSRGQRTLEILSVSHETGAQLSYSSNKATPVCVPSVKENMKASASSSDKTLIKIPDPDFHDFDSRREETEVKSGQVWAIYDDQDGMPRFYAQISQVSTSPFSVNLCWLEPTLSTEESKKWFEGTDLVVSCGEFKIGKPDVTERVNIFSHLVFSSPAKAEVVKIVPKQYEIWAMYKDWDQGSKRIVSVKDGGKYFRYEIVQVLSDYCEIKGCQVQMLRKTPGFTALFSRSRTEGMRHLPASDLSKFSHLIISEFLKESALGSALGFPDDTVELDTAAVPPHLLD